MKRSFLFWSLLCGALLCGCSIEDETLEEKAVIPPPPTAEETLQGNFTDLSRRCVIGHTDVLPVLHDMYMKSVKDRDFEPRFMFQTAEHTELYEKCVQKAASEGQAVMTDYIIVAPMQCAYISREFYARGALTDGAFWLRRVLNLQGFAQGYETAGNLFIRNEKTFATGVKLLAEAAHQGNSAAAQTLSGLVSSGSALTARIAKSAEEESESAVETQLNTLHDQAAADPEDPEGSAPAAVPAEAPKETSKEAPKDPIESGAEPSMVSDNPDPNVSAPLIFDTGVR